MGADATTSPEADGVGTLADVMPAACATIGLTGFPDAIGLREVVGDKPNHAVVLLVDGLGWHQVRAHADLAPRLQSDRRLSTAFPSTTPVGLASLGTGASPGVHGMMGAAFLLPETGDVLHPLSWADDPHPQAVQPERTVLERAVMAGATVRSVGPRAFARSGLTRAALRGGDYVGADSVGERIAEACVAAQGPTLTYVYWGDLDKTGHVHGVGSDAWREELTHVDGIVERLQRRLPSNAFMVVTADHGMVDCPEEDKIDIDALAPLQQGVRRIAGEPRMRHVYARPGAAAEVAATWEETLGSRAWVLSREGAVDAGLFGDVEPDYAERIGDVIAIARDRVALASPRVDALVSSLRGQHGALSDEEMAIPLIVRGREG